MSICITDYGTEAGRLDGRDAFLNKILRIEKTVLIKKKEKVSLPSRRRAPVLPYIIYLQSLLLANLSYHL